MFGAVHYLKYFEFKTSVCHIAFVKLTELPSVWERATNPAYHMLFRCLLRYICSSFSLIFRTNFGF